jgi:hypothetical protein
MSTAVLSPPTSLPLSPADPPGTSLSPTSSAATGEVNPIHLLAAASSAASASREVHIERVDSAQVVLRTGPQPESTLERAERRLVGAAHTVSAAVHPHPHSSDASKYGALAAESPRATSPSNVVLTDSSGTVKKTLKQLYPNAPAFDPPPSPPASDEMLPQEEPAEEDVMAALGARSSSPEPKPSQPPPSVSFNADDPAGDGLLHPPTRVPGPTRRNTTGTLASPSPKARKMAHSHSQSGGPSLGHTRTRSQTMAGQDLHSDILKEAEQIRRERNSKRSKDTRDTDDKVLVGNLIGEGHSNYVLMYNMLTGIRIGVRPPCLPLFHLAHQHFRFRVAKPS